MCTINSILRVNCVTVLPPPECDKGGAVAWYTAAAKKSQSPVIAFVNIAVPTNAVAFKSLKTEYAAQNGALRFEHLGRPVCMNKDLHIF